MTSALILKEVRQHWLPLLLIAALAGFGVVVMIVFTAFQAEAGSTLVALAAFLKTLFVIVALALCNRLVVREYQSQTQLFLQALPISRVHMVAVKYVFGLLILMAIVSAAFLLVLMLGQRSEQFTGRFVAILASRTFAYSWCLYSCFFMMGLLGRYRVAIYIFGILAAFALDTLTQFEIERFGPFALMNDQFGYERVDWPIEALATTLALAATFVVLTFALSLVREGSIASLLAEKMSHREKIFVVALLLAFFFAVSIFDERSEKQPFDLRDAQVVELDDVTVKVSLGASGDEQRGRQLAHLVAEHVASLQVYLELEELPPIFIVQRRDLDAVRYERAELDGAEGLLVRCNFLSEEWEDRRFVSWLIRELLILSSDGRVKYEPNRWVLDGFALYFPTRAPATTAEQTRQLELRAAYGGRLGVSPDDAVNWLTYRERVGEDIASAVAWRGLVSLRDSQGEERMQEFLRAILDCDVPGDARGVWYEWRNPISQLMQRQAGLSYADFRATWMEDLETLAASRDAELAAIPRLRGEIDFEAISTSSRVVAFNFISEPPLPPMRQFTLMYTELPPFDGEVPENQLRREVLRYAQHRQGELPGSFTRGTRFYATFSCWADQLGCEIISGWTRREMR